jgi:excinuclease UvrABC helicase subunit UvrB
MKEEEIRTLSKFLKFFINRPNHLARYLVENDALNNDFQQKLKNFEKKNVDESKLVSLYFLNIDQMTDFFKKLITKTETNTYLSEDVIKELENELQICIEEERYEDAIRIRDYLKKIKSKKSPNT